MNRDPGKIGPGPARAEDAPRPAHPLGRIVALCLMMTILGPISLGLFSPVLPVLPGSLNISPATAQLTMSGFLGGFCAAQLFCGPLSDAFGRRPVALGFIAVYLAASLIALTVDSGAGLIAVRVLQGTGAAVGWAMSRAVVRDLYTGVTAARAMTLIGLFMGLTPAIAPSLGGVSIALLGWRGVFILMTAVAAASVVGIALKLPETNLHPNPQAVSVRRFLAVYGGLLSDADFLRPALALGCSVGTAYSLLSVMPFVIISRLGYSPAEFGLLLILQAMAIVLSSLVMNRLVRRFALHRLAEIGLAIQLGSAMVQVAMLWQFGLTIVTVMLPFCLLAVGNAFTMPTAATIAVNPFPEIAGAAASLMSFMQIALGLGGSLAVAAMGAPVVAMVAVPALFSAAGLIAIQAGRDRPA